EPTPVRCCVVAHARVSPVFIHGGYSGAIMGRTGVVLSVLLAAGCAGSSGGGGLLAWQQNYARSIPDPGTRASMTGSGAMSAAYIGDAAMVKAALDDLKGDPAHDEYAGKCAVELARRGQDRDARRVAKQIDDPTVRKDILDKITPKPEEPPPDQSNKK